MTRAMELRRRLKPHIDGVVNRLLRLTNSDDELVSLKATQEVLTRFYGKPDTAANEEAGALLVDALRIIRDRAASEAATVLDVTPHVTDDDGSS